jgi:pimeloyl-ACP methyl ester carboxylesterase
MPVRMLSVDTPEVTARTDDRAARIDQEFQQLAEWIRDGKAPVEAPLAGFLLPKLDTGRAGRLGLKIALAFMGRDWVSGAAEHHFLKGFSTMRPEALMETYRAICEAGLPDMTRIRAPVLVVTGQAESGMIFRHAAEIARQVGRAELATVPGGHVTNLDAPDAFNAALDGFFGRWLAGTSLSD